MNSIKKITEKYWLMFYLCFISINNIHCQQYDNLKISKNQRIAQVEDNFSWIEPVLASHPLDSKFLLAASFKSNNDNYLAPRKSIGVFKSTNGGESWSKKELFCLDCSDPWITITNKGIIFLSTMGRNPNNPTSSPNNILVFTSLDSGETWSTSPQFIEGSFDGPRTISANDGTLYLTSQRGVRNDENIGRNAIYVGRAEPGQIEIKPVNNHIPSNLQLNVDAPFVLSDGTLFISYFDFQRKVDGGFRTREGRLKKRREWAIKSKDRGESFSEALFITEEASFRPNSFMASKDTNESIYFASMNENLTEIIFLYSSDYGDEWTQAKIEAPAEKERSRFYPQIAVNKDGLVALAWMDFRDSNENSCFAPYISISYDGGKTFSSPVKVALEISCVNREKLNPAKRWEVGGDYFGLTATSDGKFHILWPDARNGSFEIWYSSIEVNKN